MLTTFEQLKTFYNALIQKIKGFRGNWNQNDSTADDYIKGRTHYSEFDNLECYSNNALTVSEGYADINLPAPLVEGQEYTVIFNGIEYNLKARYYTDWECGVLGNADYLSGSDGIDTDVPFGIEFYDSYAYAWFYSDDGTYNISIFQNNAEIIHKLDKKYLPNTSELFNFIDEDWNDVDYPKQTFILGTANSDKDEYLYHFISADEYGLLGIKERLQKHPTFLGNLNINSNDFTNINLLYTIDRNKNSTNDPFYLLVYDKDSYTISPVIIHTPDSMESFVNGVRYDNKLKQQVIINNYIFLFTTLDSSDSHSQKLSITIEKLGKATDIQYLDGTTSNIQEQLNNKINITDELITVADIDTICGATIQLASETTF